MSSKFFVALMMSVALSALVCMPLPAKAIQVTLPAQSLDDSLRMLGTQTDTNVLFNPSEIRNLRAPAIQGAASFDEALTALLANTGMTYRYINERTVTLLRIESKPVRTSMLSDKNSPDKSTMTLVQN